MVDEAKVHQSDDECCRISGVKNFAEPEAGRDGRKLNDPDPSWFGLLSTSLGTLVSSIDYLSDNCLCDRR